MSRFGAENSYYRHGHTSGGSPSPEYNAWAHLLDRCRNPKNRKFHLYGGRGITVCARWEASFENFLADMGKRPGSGYSIERIKNHLGYEPGNCKWATTAEQARNRRANRYVTIDGQRLCLVDAARLAKLPFRTFRMRLEHGWPLERAFHTPVQRRRTNTPVTSADTRS